MATCINFFRAVKQISLIYHKLDVRTIINSQYFICDRIYNIFFVVIFCYNQIIINQPQPKLPLHLDSF